MWPTYLTVMARYSPVIRQLTPTTMALVDRYHHGLKNLSASIDVIASTFPAPDRILLTGNSAGGFGTDYMLPLVRKLYPDTPIDLSQ